MFNTFILTASACLLGASLLTALIPDERIKPFAKLGISFVILAVFTNSIFGITDLDLEIPEVDVPTQELSIVDIYARKVEQSIMEEYGVRSTAEVEIDDENHITLRRIILFDSMFMLEIKEKYRPEEIEVL